MQMIIIIINKFIEKESIFTMYVCVCNAVTERHIHEAVQEGAKTVKHLKETLGVGSECGRCVTCAKACLKEAKAVNKQPFVRNIINIAPVQLGAS
jgi:bacterioferritin-associated ferredoxin